MPSQFLSGQRSQKGEPRLLQRIVRLQIPCLPLMGAVAEGRRGRVRQPFFVYIGNCSKSAAYANV